MAGAGEPTGGSNSAAPAKNGWTNNIGRDKASDLGYTEVKDAPFNSHNQLTFKSGSKFITPDIDGHTGSQSWKVFDSSGNRLGTYNTDLMYYPAISYIYDSAGVSNSRGRLTSVYSYNSGGTTSATMRWAGSPPAPRPQMARPIRFPTATVWPTPSPAKPTHQEEK